MGLWLLRPGILPLVPDSMVLPPSCGIFLYFTTTKEGCQSANGLEKDGGLWKSDTKAEEIWRCIVEIARKFMKILAILALS